MSPNEAAPGRRPLRAALGGALAFVLVLLTGASAKGCTDLEAIRDRESELQRRMAASDELIGGLKERLTSLRYDPVTLERVAREELGLVMPEDRVIVLSDEMGSVVSDDTGSVVSDDTGSVLSDETGSVVSEESQSVEPDDVVPVRPER